MADSSRNRSIPPWAALHAFLDAKSIICSENPLSDEGLYDYQTASPADQHQYVTYHQDSIEASAFAETPASTFSAQAQTQMSTPRSRNDFRIAIICALPLEADAVESLFDHRWDIDGDPYGKARGDPNAYSTGMIGAHNVVLVYMPGMGKSHGAAVAAYCRSSFPRIKLALVVGICGGAPAAADGKQIYLGDAIISSGLVQYDFGRRNQNGFLRKDTILDNLGRPSLEIRALLAKLQGRRSRQKLQDRLGEHLSTVTGQLGWEYAHPRGSTSERLPVIHIGLVASGDQVMKSEEARDMLIAEEEVIAFEMESAGVWDTFPCLVIKGVADYADCHKNKQWQNYAAASAAACAKAFLELWI